MSTSGANRNLLFGILVRQMDFISREQLVAATGAWLLDKSKSIEEILVDQQALSPADRQLIAPLVERHIQNHGGDAGKSLAALSSIGSIAEDLKALGDTQLEATLAVVASARHDRETSQTIDRAGGASSIDTGPIGGSRYRILRPHAKGGLGEVSVAWDTELNRDVALKVIQPRLARDESSRSRFVLEAEVTGGLEHPGIVPVYGLGQYADGRPYYAMRFIRGDSLKDAITHFYSAKPTDPGKRTLELRKLLGRFIDVCQAMEYAHSRGVLHRDLKPGNIMLGKYGETLVIDWGLAKFPSAKDSDEGASEPLLRPSSGTSAAPTQFGSAIGTPAYMSPEQAAGNIDQVGRCSDVYNLGATLFHILTGQPPVTGEDVDEILQRVREGAIAEPRDIEPRVPRALAAICRKATAFEPAERYASAAALAEDVEHWLADAPTTACPDTWLDRTARWARRHRAWAVSGAAAITLVAIISTVAAVLIDIQRNETARQKNKAVALAQQNESLFKRESEARADAETRRRQSEQAQREAEAVSQFIVKAFRSPDPARDGRSVTVAETLRLAAETLSDSPDVDALTRAKLLESLGESFLGLGLPHDAVGLLRQCSTIRSEALGPRDPLTLTAINNLGVALTDADETDEALSLLGDTFQRRKEQLGADHRDTLISMGNLGRVHYQRGDYQVALPLLEDALRRARASLVATDSTTLAAMSSLGTLCGLMGDFEKAQELLKESLRLTRDTFGAEHPDTLARMNNLAAAYGEAGALDKAVELTEEVLRIRQTKLGPDHPDTLISMSNMARAYLDVGNLEKALPLYEETLKRRRKILGPEHLVTLQSMNGVATAYRAAGDLQRALELYEETLDIKRRKLAPGHPSLLTSMNNLAGAYYRAGQLEKALPLFEETLAGFRESLGPDNPRTLSLMGNVAVVYRASGRLEQAVAAYEEASRRMTEKLGADHPMTLVNMHNLGLAYQKLGQPDKALPILQETLRRRREKLTADHPDSLTTANALGMAYAHAGRLKEALPIFQDTYERSAATRAKHWFTFVVQCHLGRALTKTEQYEEAEPALLAAYKGLTADTSRVPVPMQRKIRETAETLVLLYELWEKPDEAAKWRAQLQALAD